MSSSYGGKHRSKGVATRHNFLSPKVQKVAERIAKLPCVHIVHPSKWTSNGKGTGIRIQGDKFMGVKIFVITSRGSQELVVCPVQGVTNEVVRTEIAKVKEELEACL